MSQPIIKRSRVQFDPEAIGQQATPVNLVATAGASAPHGQKAVRLLEEGGVVRAIELTCTCGDVTAIELAYPGEKA